MTYATAPVTTPTSTPPASVDPTLVKILSWKRPHGSTNEREFCAWLRGELQRLGFTPMTLPEDCFCVSVPRKDGHQTSTLFSCHVDTVHSNSDGAQQIAYDPTFGHIFLAEESKKQGNCLGADDGVGVWIMLRMIEEKVPGVYVFHRGEERGTIGSRAILRDKSAWLATFDLAIAFDRPNTYEVITHQGGLRTCSDKFATALCKAINDQGVVTYEPSARGVLTDTKVYRGVIPECTNIGVGYFDQHGPDEYLDYTHAVDLLDCVLNVNWDALPVDRDPKTPDPVYGGYSGYGMYGVPGTGKKGGAGGQHRLPWGWEEELDEAEEARPAGPVKPAAAAPVASPQAANEPHPSTLEELDMMTNDDIRTLCAAEPESAARVILDLYLEVKALETKLSVSRNLLGI